MKRRRRLPVLLLSLALFVSCLPAASFAESSTQWQQTGSGTNTYAEFPSGYNTGSSLYAKYNKQKLVAYENSTTKRVVTTERISYIYWHWSWRVGATANGKYNFYINDKNAGDETHASYPYFSDFESTSNYSWNDPDGNHDDSYRCGYMWRNKPDVDGSWWWYQIPVYKQTYTDYKLVSTNDGNTNTNTNTNTSTSTNSSAGSSSGGTSSSASKYTPKKTSVSKCTPSLKSCKIKWKKCSGKCTGYQIRYSTNRNFSNSKTKTVKGRKKTSCKLTGLKAGTTYYYQIRCYRKAGKKTYYSAWSVCKSFTTKGLFTTPGYYMYKCIKKGNYVYCGIRNKLVKVNLKTKKVRTLATGHPEFLDITNLCVKNGYIYFACYDGEDYSTASLYRVTMSGKNKKVLYAGDSSQHNDKLLGYYVKGNTIYYLVEAWTDKNATSLWAGYTMNIDGSNKKLAGYLDPDGDWGLYKNIGRYYKVCNVRGYTVDEKETELKGNKYKMTVRVKTPKGKKIKIGSYIR